LEAFDPRTTLAREDLAEQSLEGIVRARAYRAAQPLQCVVASASIRNAPDVSGEQLDQLVFGEVFQALERRGDWVWGQARRDGYVGWVAASSLEETVLAPTHRVSAIRTFAFPAPDMKSAPPAVLTLNALVTVEAREGRFVKLARSGWVVEAHLADFGTFETDPAAVAERHLGAPYQWGGRESLGLDCSGLVQQALFACGRACPRDADMQEAETGTEIDAGAGYANLRRGDLVFWKDHVAVMVDPTTVIHANGHHMQVVMEPLAEVVARNRASGMGEPVRFRRL
jgi:cell wall-associated NlpC family hydrolase